MVRTFMAAALAAIIIAIPHESNALMMEPAQDHPPGNYFGLNISGKDPFDAGSHAVTSAPTEFSADTIQTLFPDAPGKNDDWTPAFPSNFSDAPAEGRAGMLSEESVVPEPATVVLMAMGLAGILCFKVRKART